jgi:hypothetical protein
MKERIFDSFRSEAILKAAKFMSLDLENSNNEPSRTAHAAPYETLRAFERADRHRELRKKALLVAIYVVAVLAATWAIRRS